MYPERSYILQKSPNDFLEPESAAKNRLRKNSPEETGAEPLFENSIQYPGPRISILLCILLEYRSSRFRDKFV